MSPATMSPSGISAANSRSVMKRNVTPEETGRALSGNFECGVVRIMEAQAKQHCLSQMDCSHGSQNYH
jgi:hypothetical protein